MEFRQKFHSDVFIDILCYRKYGHNEGDEPRFTQPKLYKAISKHKNPRDIYAAKLIEQGVIDNGYVKKLEEDYKAKLEENLEDSRKQDKTVITPFMQNEWVDYITVQEHEMMQPVDTSYSKDGLSQITDVISNLPKDKNSLEKLNVWLSLDVLCLMKISWIGQWQSIWLMEPYLPKVMM